MLPDNYVVETSTGLPYPKQGVRDLKVSYELGGEYLSQPTEKMTYLWKAYTTDTGISIEREGQNSEILKNVTGNVNEVSLTFDQNMRPTLAYVEDGISKLYWYDTSSQSMRTSVFNVKNPRVAIDDKRKFNISNSDIVFAYINQNNDLAYRLQRERYSIEHLIIFDRGDSVGGLVLGDMGMNLDNRFVFNLGFKEYGKPIEMNQPQDARLAYPEASWISECGSVFPSHTQWLYKNLVKADELTKSEAVGLPDLPYSTTASSRVMGFKSTFGSGDTTTGQPIQEKISLDWVRWAISQRVWGLLYNKEKINATVGGAEIIVNEVKRVLEIAVTEGIFVSYRMGDVVLDSRNNNISIKFTAQLEHTILSAEVSGSLYQ